MNPLSRKAFRGLRFGSCRPVRTLFGPSFLMQRLHNNPMGLAPARP
jgi:hypothetical protein